MRYVEGRPFKIPIKLISHLVSNFAEAHFVGVGNDGCNKTVRSRHSHRHVDCLVRYNTRVITPPAAVCFGHLVGRRVDGEGGAKRGGSRGSNRGRYRGKGRGREEEGGGGRRGGEEGEGRRREKRKEESQ